MKILFLGPMDKSQKRIIQYLEGNGSQVVVNQSAISHEMFDVKDSDYLISYGYRFIISSEVLEIFGNRAINLHISFLPWNRGADPNLWSIIEDSPKGISVHQIDEGIDTGDIIYQKKVKLDLEGTLRESYNKLQKNMESSFIKIWPKITDGSIVAFKQIGEGSYHKSKDKELYSHLLTNGWDTKIKGIIGKAI